MKNLKEIEKYLTGRFQKRIVLNEKDFWDYFGLLTNTIKEIYMKMGSPMFNIRTDEIRGDRRPDITNNPDWVICFSYKGIAVVRENDLR